MKFLTSNIRFTIGLFTTTIFIGAAAHAAEVLSARLDGRQENILVEVKYWGGCQKHKFELQLKGCFESMPVQCQAKLVETGPLDECEALLHETVVFNLAALGLNTNYYSNGSLSIAGDPGQNGKPSQAIVRLPEVNANPSRGPSIPPAVPPSGDSSNVISCRTHTGSVLSINESHKIVTIRPVSGAAVTTNITGVRRRTIETNPPIDSRRYSLDDGRQIVIEAGLRGTKGYYVRLDGSTSPEFSCTQGRGALE